MGSQTNLTSKPVAASTKKQSPPKVTPKENARPVTAWQTFGAKFLDSWPKSLPDLWTAALARFGTMRHVVQTLLAEDSGQAEHDVDPLAAAARNVNLARLLGWQAVATFILILVALVASSILRPVMVFRSMAPNGTIAGLTPLLVPNLTNDTVLSWAATSVTEILTVGFGDFDKQILGQYHRFTPEGWESFAAAIRTESLREAFKQSQIVMTTVPKDTPIITQQGLSEDESYQWQVSMPVVMTYVTNNGVTTRRQGMINLTIERVSPAQNKQGIAIRLWRMT